MVRYAIGLGSNQGDRLGHLVGACVQLEETFGPITVSALYETDPVGGPEQGPYLNAVAVVETELGPFDVLAALQEIESSHGRERVVRWGPRTLDLDLLAGPPVDSEDLVVPHPRAHEREFVLRPLAEVWPEAPVGRGMSAVDALGRFEAQGVDRLGADWRPPVSRLTANLLLGAQFTLIALVGLLLVVDGRLPEGVSVWPLVGGVLALLGGALALWAAGSLGSSLTASPLPGADSTLVTRGPYRFARHPIYGGLILLLGGSALALGSVSALLVSALLVPLFLIKSGYEERRLRMRYADYRAYMRGVPRRFVPFVG